MALGKQLPGIFVAFKKTTITSLGCTQKRHGTGQERRSLSPPGHTRVCHGVLLPFTNLPKGKGAGRQRPWGSSQVREQMLSAPLPTSPPERSDVPGKPSMGDDD